MARSIATIQNLIIATIQADSTLNAKLTTPSNVAIWRLFSYVVAVAIALFEQILDIFKAEVDAEVLKAVPGTPQWVKGQSLMFQYDATTPQVASVDTNTFQVTYPLVDATKRIITQCAVGVSVNQDVNVKVAKGIVPALSKLSSSELTAFQTYWNDIGFAGIQYNAISLDADLVEPSAVIYYDGQYTTVIQANVEAAINNFLASIPFDGQLLISSLEIAILAVPGVKDVTINYVKARSATVVIGSQITVVRVYDTTAGYCIAETTSGHTLSDTITYVVN